MPSNWLTIDTNFPTFTGEESEEQQIRALHNYLFQLREGLQYSLQNLTAENFNAAAWQGLQEDQKTEVAEEMQRISASINQLITRVDNLASRVAGAENLASRISTAEEEVNALAEWMAEAQNSIDDLSTRMGATEGTQSALLGRMTNAEQKISKLETVAKNTSAAIRTLEETVQQRGTQLKQNTERIGDLESAIAGENGLQARVEALEILLNQGGST